MSTLRSATSSIICRAFSWGGLEGAYRRWSIGIDVQYLKVEDRSITPPPPAPPGTRADCIAKQTMIEVQARYQLSHTAPLAIDMLVGGRGWVLDNAVRLSLDAQPTTNLALNERWTDPFGGVRASIDLSPRLLLQIHGDAGGFGVGSKFTWQAFGTLRYRISSRWTARVGYRAVDIDFKDDHRDFFYDVVYRGPIVSATYGF
jgi:opacity protein-like surface antigen